MTLITLNKDVFVYSLFYVESEEGNFLGFFYEENGERFFNYRTRQFDPESTDVFDEKDEKKFYSMKSTESKEDMLVKIRLTMTSFAAMMKSDLIEIEINKKGDDPSILETFDGLPFFHMKEMKDI